MCYAFTMAVKLNHTIVYSRDSRATAEFYVSVFGLGAIVPFGLLLEVALANECTLAFLDADADVDIQKQHYAFHVSEEEFDAIWGRVKERKLDYWADPFHTRKGAINGYAGGRGVYFDDPNGHILEILTRA